jgi:LmbE family N-acetylglucosaminyl deacetylase
MVIVAHPDDEVIGAGALLGRLAGPVVVHVTDGAPRDLVDARSAGFDSAAGYAAARRREAARALALLPSKPGPTVELGVADQEASRSLAGLAGRIADLLGRERPDVVLTHAYEGGHPDHDAVAFAVHAAVRLLAGSVTMPPALHEVTGYHAGDGALVVGRFLAGSGARAAVVRLTGAERERKRRMLGCFVTQVRTLEPFVHRLRFERVRSAPAYRYSAAPHHGRLWYEHFGRGGLTGEEWRALAAAGLRALGLEEPL